MRGARPRQARRAEMGSFLSVTNGSDQPPKFIVLEYFGGAEKAKAAGAGGQGHHLRQRRHLAQARPDMDQMKFDMCGAASVLGAFRAVAELKAKVNLIGLVPTCENMPNGRATKPGDVVRSMSGQTIEVLNTDAEGRLILCDALTYAERYEPAAVVDIATLTGAMVIALGHVACGVFSNSDSLGAGAAQRRRGSVRPRLATAALGRLSGGVEQQFRRFRQHRRPCRRQHHRGVLSVPVSPRNSTGRIWTSRAWHGKKARKRARPAVRCRC